MVVFSDNPRNHFSGVMLHPEMPPISSSESLTLFVQNEPGNEVNIFVAVQFLR